jgi:hypothetical protein
MKAKNSYFWPRHYLEVSGQLQTPVALPPEKESPVAIGQDAGWASVFGLCGVEKNLSVLRAI